MKKKALIYAVLSAVLCSLLLTGCSFTEAWFKRPYLNGKVTEAEAVADINNYIVKDVKNGNRLLFTESVQNPLTSSMNYTNAAGLALSFETGKADQHILAMTLVFDNTDQSAVKDAETITRIVCEMIEPIDYILNSNTNRMLNHMHIGSTDLTFYSFADSNNVVEKIAFNECGIPCTIIRFRFKFHKDLKTYLEEIGETALSNPMFWQMFE